MKLIDFIYKRLSSHQLPRRIINVEIVHAPERFVERLRHGRDAADRGLDAPSAHSPELQPVALPQRRVARRVAERGKQGLDCGAVPLRLGRIANGPLGVGLVQQRQQLVAGPAGRDAPRQRQVRGRD
jgi:hypothetical protein